MEDFKAIIFSVGNVKFGIDINRVFSIDRMASVTVLPRLPSYMRGVLELRGEVIPLIDLRQFLLEYDDSEEMNSTRIITVKVDEQPIGLVVDAATDVLNISAHTIQRPNLDYEDISFILGVSKLNEDLLILLDIDKLLENITNLKELLQRI
ncbi:chemotaxis protein CheW [Aneurinibacillus danicus]|uniref:Chemotaxis protein CheW n=1 Tax=Aneurinibacillus danicus TaxID=267746 RepID=A0A511VAY9_9BACL|nr:chemotaxis protein CheW [Aneurinibacillus danicus]GEN35088.1 chemotaxis protein CheW [Aneurinibacillus danicus]